MNVVGTPQIHPPSATSLRVDGMNCNNCARKITDAARAIPGVTIVLTDVEARSVTVKWNTDAHPEPTLVIEALRHAGYEAVLNEPGGLAAEQSKPDRHLTMWLGAVVTATLMAGEWIFDHGMTPWFQWVAFALGLLVQTLCGARFYRGAWRQLKTGSSNMDTLVALGSTTAFGYSAWVLFTGRGGHVYFMEAAAIIALISIGHWLEARVSTRASGALRALMQLAPQTARLVSDPEHGSGIEERDVPVADLNPGDLISLRPGDHVPVDGEVMEGHSAVNEAMLTGESLPVDKNAGAKVFAGTMNLSGRLVVRVSTTGGQTALAHIIAAVQRAQNSRANIQRLGDRVSNVFVPVVVFIALASGLWWGFAPDSALRVHETLSGFLWHAPLPVGAAAGFIIAAAVLIVACPCAMGLATPAAIMAAANSAATRGILIRDGVALEQAGQVTAVIFDKTGTLTTGTSKVVAVGASRDDPARFDTVGGSSGADASAPVRLAAALARNSSHPISRAIAQLAADDIAFSGWREVRGSGVEASFQDPKVMRQSSDTLVRLGSLNWLAECGVNVEAGKTFASDWSAQGATIVGLSGGSLLRALFAVHDTLKPGAAEVIARLQRQGLKTFLLTGDNSLTAAALAKQAGIPHGNVFAGVRPERKAEFVKQLQLRGERVAFVGDGINDAPALTQADLGIAVSRASDVARESADMILLRRDIEAVPEALGLARATLRTIRQNLFWAFFYNALGVPLAAMGFMSPILCAAAMGASDLIVIGNALRLRRWKL